MNKYEEHVEVLLEDYVLNIELYGKFVEALSFTLDHIDPNSKDYAITLFAALQFIENKKVNPYSLQDLNFWKEKLEVVKKEFVLNEVELRDIVNRIITRNKY